MRGATFMNAALKIAAGARQEEGLVDVSDIQWKLKQRTIIVGDKSIRLTPTQYRLLYPLRRGAPVTYTNLAQIVYNCAIDDKVRMMIDKHIDRARHKLRGTGVYIYCVLGYGYMLLDEVVEEPPTRSDWSR
jgi:DNA-binding response OmpR family regulator